MGEHREPEQILRIHEKMARDQVAQDKRGHDRVVMMILIVLKDNSGKVWWITYRQNGVAVGARHRHWSSLKALFALHQWLLLLLLPNAPKSSRSSQVVSC